MIATVLYSQSVSQSVSVPCQNSGVGCSHGFLLTSFSHHLNEVQRSKPSRALQPPKQDTSLPPPSSLTLDSSCPALYISLTKITLYLIEYRGVGIVVGIGELRHHA